MKYMSVGLLVPNIQAEVVNWNAGSYMPLGNSGEIWLKGPDVMKGKKLMKMDFWGRMHMDVHVHDGVGAYIGVKETMLLGSKSQRETLETKAEASFPN
ncbi:hypothetical protein IFM89_004643 [Coptis chinensis]|uniref:AMP-dependent synthetase/ligase domain-containing protein n=1 Tax=Coptis chinensis TaxID=261450 RepID=A0A835H3L7_9MAGN|nr:hypothetical protein IFM89_004643 [Coptis chinensis]